MAVNPPNDNKASCIVHASFHIQILIQNIIVKLLPPGIFFFIINKC